HGKRVEAAQRGRQAWVGAGPYGFAEESDNGLDLQVSAAQPQQRGPHGAQLTAGRGGRPGGRPLLGLAAQPRGGDGQAPAHALAQIALQPGPRGRRGHSIQVTEGDDRLPPVPQLAGQRVAVGLAGERRRRTVEEDGHHRPQPGATSTVPTGNGLPRDSLVTPRNLTLTLIPSAGSCTALAMRCGRSCSVVDSAEVTPATTLSANAAPLVASGSRPRWVSRLTIRPGSVAA